MKTIVECVKEQVGHKVNDPIYSLTKKVGEMLTIDFNPVDEGEFMFEQAIYLYFLSCLCFIIEIFIGMLE